MKRIVTLLLAVLAPSVAHAVDIPVTLRDGAVWTQTSVHVRADTKDGVTETTTATHVIKMTYRKEGSADTLRQDFVSFDIDGFEGEQLKALSDQARILYPVVVEVDEALMPVRVRDWDQMRDTMFRAIAAHVTDARALNAVKASYAKMDATQAATLLREQTFVSLGQGTRLALGEARAYEGEIPNVLGGPPIKTSGTFRLESVDKASGRAVIIWSQTPDPASLLASMKAMTAAIAARLGPEKLADAKAQLANLTLERDDRCRYEIDLPTGLATKTDCTIELRSGMQGQLEKRNERWVISQTLPETP